MANNILSIDFDGAVNTQNTDRAIERTEKN